MKSDTHSGGHHSPRKRLLSAISD